MPLPDSDGAAGHSFGLEVDGAQLTKLTGVTGLKLERDVIELEENGPDGKVVRKLPGRWRSPEITLTRGITSDSSFGAWVKEAQSGQGDFPRRSGAIVVYDVEGSPVKRYAFTNAWPRSLEIFDLGVGDATVLSERLVLVCERLEPE